MVATGQQLASIATVAAAAHPALASGQRVIRWSLRLLLMVLGLVFPLLALELALRTQGSILPGAYMAHMYGAPHPLYGFARIPSTTGWIKTDEFMARVDINSHGLRERELPYQKPAGVHRILILGDSFVEGVQVHAEATVSRRLEALLNASGDGAVQTINAGIGAWGTTQELLFLRHEGLRYRPDLVALVFYTGNDVTNNSFRVRGSSGRNPRRPYFALTKAGELELLPWRPKKPEDDGLIERLRRDSMLFNVLDTGMLTKLRAAVPSGPNDEKTAEERLVEWELPVFSAQPSSAWQEAWLITEAILAAARDDATGAGATFLLVGAPTMWEVYPEEWDRFRERKGLPAGGWDFDGPNRRLAELATRLGIGYLDLRPALREAAPGGTPLYFHRDIHWTAAGHEVAARALAEYLQAVSHWGTHR